MIDNQPKTTSEKQVVSDVFGQCKSYPHISTQSEITQATTEVQQQPVTGPVPKQSVKRKTKSEKPPAKKAKTQSAKKPKKVKPWPKTQTKPKKSRKPAIYKPKFIKSPPRESFTEEEQFDSEEEQFNPEEEEEFYSEEEEEPRHLTQYELNAFAGPRTGFGPRIVYE